MNTNGKFCKTCSMDPYTLVFGLACWLVLGSLPAAAQPDCWVRQSNTPYNASIIARVLDDQGQDVTAEVTLAAFRGDGSFSSVAVAVNEPNQLFLNYNGAEINDEASFLIYHNGAVYTATPANILIRAGEIYGLQTPITFSYELADVLDEADYCTGSGSGDQCMGQELEIDYDHTVNTVLQAEHTISSTAFIASGAEVTYQAGTQITLSPGFQVAAGGEFRAEIGDCATPPAPEAVIRAQPMEMRTGVDKQTSFEIFPNPSGGFFRLDWEFPEETSVRIGLYSPSGQLLQDLVSESNLSRGHHRRDITLTDLPAGIYWLVLSSGSTRITRQLILIR